MKWLVSTGRLCDKVAEGDKNSVLDKPRDRWVATTVKVAATGYLKDWTAHTRSIFSLTVLNSLLLPLSAATEER